MGACQQHVTRGNFRGLESSGSQSWKWGKGRSITPAVGLWPRPVGERWPVASWARHPQASPGLAASHQGRYTDLQTGWLASGLQGRYRPAWGGRAVGRGKRRPHGSTSLFLLGKAPPGPSPCCPNRRAFWGHARV